MKRLPFIDTSISDITPFNHDNTPDGMRTPKGAARAAKALEVLEEKAEAVTCQVNNFLSTWGSKLQELVRTSDSSSMSNDLDSLINAHNERVEALSKLFHAMAGR